MNGILSEEANKVQSELDHASMTVAARQQQSSGACSAVSNVCHIFLENYTFFRQIALAWVFLLAQR